MSFCVYDAPAERKLQNRQSDPLLSLDQRRRLPYGVYYCANGDTVVFDRRYQPRFCRDRNGVVHRDHPGRWVDGIIGHAWFYDDNSSPRVNGETLRRILAIRGRWEAAAAGMQLDPRLLVPIEWVINVKRHEAA